VQQKHWVAWAVVASSILGTLFREPLGDFIYDILTNLFPDDHQPAQIIAAFLKTYWPWALAALSAMVVLVVYGQNSWFRRRQPSLEPSASPDTQPTITASCGSPVVTGSVTAGDRTTITIGGGTTVDVNRLAEQLIEPYRQQLTDFQQREQLYQDQIRALTDTITALAEQRRQPDAPPGIEVALARLHQGETEDAERIFETIVDRRAADIQEAAAALRHLGTLAFLHDINKALHAYRRSVELDPDNAEGWNQLGYLLYRVGQPDEAVAAYKRVYRIGEETGHLTFQAIASNNLGIMYQIRRDLEKAETRQRKALTLHETIGNKEGMAIAYSSLGHVYRIRGALEKAETKYRKALTLHETIGNKEGMAIAYSNFGNLYWTQGKLEQAEMMCQKAIALREAVGSKEITANAYGTLGNVYWTQGKLEQAETKYRKALALHETIGNKEGIAIAYDNLGIMYQIRGDLEKAETMHRKALTLHETIGNKQGIAKAYGNLGIMYQTRGALEKAETKYRKALSLFQQISAMPQVEQTRDRLRKLRE
jgi:tetratricopeptide (TPR) repeat protein